MKLLILSIVASLLVLASPAYASGPSTHLYVTKLALEDPQLINSPIATLMRNNWDCCMSGIMTEDITVAYYYSNWKNYDATHSWRFDHAMLSASSGDCELAFSYCLGVHLVQDSVSHNQFVPDKIRGTLIPNAIIHPIVEGMMESWLLRPDHHPEILQETKVSMQWILNNPAMIQKVQNNIYSASTPHITLNVKNELNFFSSVIQEPSGLYTQIFHLPSLYDLLNGSITVGALILAIGAALVFVSIKKMRKSEHIYVRIAGYIVLLLGIILVIVGVFIATGGLSTWSNDPGYEKTINDEKQATIFILSGANWDQLADNAHYEPTGFDSLNLADSQVMPYSYLILALIIGIIIYGGYLYVKGGKP